MIIQYGLLSLILTGGALLSIKAGKLTVAGASAGILLGWLVFKGAGFTGIAMTATFFLLGTGATSFGKKRKEHQGLSAVNSSKRNAGQVMANAGVAALCGLAGWFYKDHIFIFRLLMAAALSSASADTLSSELGNVWGKKFYNILTLKKDNKGLNGVVSVEGTAIGVAGSIMIATVYSVGFGFAIQTFLIIVAAGTIGNICDSLLGASLERKHYLNNDAVNFLNTFVAALSAFAFYSLL